jgi:iron(III) transport system ATP-binding protein
MSYLILDHIIKRFAARGGSGEVVAVDNISLRVERGEFVTLLGPSGCGKTTTLRMIAGFEVPTEGQLILDGAVINDRPPNRREMAMVFQSYALFPHLTVLENVAYGLRLRNTPEAQMRERVRRVLEIVGLLGLEQRAPNQLSGGQQQRVALARALVMEPKVLLMDEPLSNLDAKLREQMRTEIRRIQQTFGITTVYVTHDQSEAMTLSDRIVVMNGGRIDQAAPPTEIYQRPRTAFVADFIGRSNFLSGTVAGQEDGMLLVDVLDRRLRVPVSAAAAPLRAGDAAQLLIRPEAVRIAASGMFAGIVRRATYLGPVVEYDVALGDELINALDADPLRTTIFDPPSEVGVDFLDGCLYLLPSSAV